MQILAHPPVLIPLLFNLLIGVTPLTRHIVRCHAGVATLLRRHGNVVTPAWQRCYAGMATLLCRHGNRRSGMYAQVQAFTYWILGG